MDQDRDTKRPLSASSNGTAATEHHLSTISSPARDRASTTTPNTERTSPPSHSAANSAWPVPSIDLTPRKHQITMDLDHREEQETLRHFKRRKITPGRRLPGHVPVRLRDPSRLPPRLWERI